MNETELKHLIYDETSDDELEALAKKAHSLTIQRFGKTINLYAPVYLSNRCVNSCLYCGFSKSANIERMALTPNEAIEEAKYLIREGHRHILLVSSEDPQTITPDYFEYIAGKLKGMAAKLTIEVEPFDEKTYRRLFLAGVDGVTLYQETYHADTYAKMHAGGPKSSYAARLKAIESAGRAGMSFLGIGALLGLYDWRCEIFELIRHARELKKRFWKSAISVSVPRIRDSSSGFAMPAPVSDFELARIIIILRLALPDCDIVLSTREPAELRDNFFKLGVTQMSAGSKTHPGGYGLNKSSGRQFEIEDTRLTGEVAQMISNTGYQPVFKDWVKI